MSEESKRKRRESMLRMISADPDGWRKKVSGSVAASHTPEAEAKRQATNAANGNHEKCSEAMSAAMGRPDVRATLSAERKKRAKTPKGRAQILSAAKASMDPEVRARQKKSIQAYARSKEGREARRRAGVAATKSLLGASARKEHEYNGHRFRSGWEKDFARWLDSLGVKWVYEPEVFELDEGDRYIPDFLVSIPGGQDFLVEIKGKRWYGGGVDKFNRLRSQNPDKPAVMLMEKEIMGIKAALREDENGS